MYAVQAIVDQSASPRGVCATNRNGYVESGPIKAGPNRYPVRVLGVKGSHPEPQRDDSRDGAVGGVELEPVTHDLLISVGRFGTAPTQEVTIAFKVQPCTHYYVIADTEGLVPPAWKLVVEHEEPMKDCAPISSQK